MIFTPRRFPVAIDPRTGDWLYPCAIADCERLTPSKHCCVWCEYLETYGVKVPRHSAECEARKYRCKDVFRLDRVTPV